MTLVTNQHRRLTTVAWCCVAWWSSSSVTCCSSFATPVLPSSGRSTTASNAVGRSTGSSSATVGIPFSSSAAFVSSSSAVAALNVAGLSSSLSSQSHSHSFARSRNLNSRLYSTATTTISSTTTTTTTTPETSKAAAAAAPEKVEIMIDDGSKTPAEKLEALRALMKEQQLDVWIIPTDDPHLSEYVPDAYKRREYLTGFKGSAGTAVVTADGAWLWTDSRYWNEAQLQLDSAVWTLQKVGLPQTQTVAQWLAARAVTHYNNQADATFPEKEEQVPESNTDDSNKTPLRIGMDPFVHAASFAKEVHTALDEAAKEAGLEDADGKPLTVGTLVTVSERNLVDELWGTTRPPIPTSPWRVHPVEYAGISVPTKLAKIRKEMKQKKSTLAVFCTLDDVAYLLNLRCQGDIATCPVGIAYATVTMDQVTLFCHEEKMKNSPADVHEHLTGVTIRPYDDILQAVAQHCQETPNAKVWLDTSRANYAISNVIPEKALLDSQNAITPMKACKNTAELQGMREAHIVDGAAMAHFMTWLEDTVASRSVSEVEIDEMLTGFRAQQAGFTEVSFPTIAGVTSNGAIVHYRAAADSPLLKHLDRQENPIVLLDSGGQYLYGTTDVTRTWYFGPTPAPPAIVDAYTRVLKGHIGVDQMIFPENTPGFVLDVYARQWLWDAEKDYGHGTGHGVGAALNVHEGPMSISPRWANKEGLRKGMIVSNEPGYYEDGNFGIRIENLLEIRYVQDEHNRAQEAEQLQEPVVEDETTPATPAPAAEGKKYLKFARLTMIPIQTTLINLDLMTDRELDWLDAYHAQVWETVSPRLIADSAEWKWLQKSCVPILRNRNRLD